MKKTLLLIITILLFSNSYGQNPLWRKVSNERLSGLEKMNRSSIPNQYELFALDFAAMKSKLQFAPLDSENVQSEVIIAFPNPNGELENYRVYESPVMEAGLANKYPDIKSYSGIGVKNNASSIRFSTTVFGLHVMSLSGNTETFYIDTYTKDLNNYIVYSKQSIHNNRNFECFVNDEQSLLENNTIQNRVNDGKFRQYRLAIACTIEYAAYHLTAAGTPSGASLAVKKGVVLAAMVVSLTRLNGVYEKEMSLRMNLVANNDAIIFIDSDSFTNSPTMINEIQPIVDAAIGSANYDMGHGFCTTDSGIAQLASVCGSGKSRGITGQPNPVGDPFDINYVAHEMGHQFGASHTQNNDCNRTADSAFEPGSASTIMGYAGICAPDVQTDSDDHFHARSILQMTSFVVGATSCGTFTLNGNTAPTVVAGSNYTIPKGTAFILKGAANDANNDALTYCWEQYNNEVSTQPPTQTATTGPNFRSFPPSTSSNRYMPRFSDVLSGNLAPTWEVVPNVARTMNFALTVRDNRLGGGMSNRGDMVVTFASVGPFQITSPNVENVTWAVGSTQNITWDVAGTTANGINTANVNILFSTNGGATFTTLVANTPNDGSQTITAPSSPFSNCRVMIEAVGNIFYAVSKNIGVGYTFTNVCNTYTNNTVQAIPDGPDPSNPVAGPTLTSTINIPVSTTITDVNVNVNVTHAWIRDLVSKVQHPDGTEVILGNRICNSQDGYNILFNDGSPAIVCVAPITSGTFTPNQPLSALNGKSSNGDWNLLINDFFQVDEGDLNSWSIEVCSLQAVLSTQNIGFDSFAVYPNPNNGNFNIQFNTDSSNGVKVLVHDMRGRRILENDFTSSATFNENIHLNNAQFGVYLLTVTDGERKEVKKIVVE